MNTGPLSSDEYRRMRSLLAQPGATVSGEIVLKLMAMVEYRDAVIRMLAKASRLDLDELLPKRQGADLSDLLQASLDTIRAHRAGGGR